MLKWYHIKLFKYILLISPKKNIFENFFPRLCFFNYALGRTVCGLWILLFKLIALWIHNKWGIPLFIRSKHHLSVLIGLNELINISFDKSKGLVRKKQDLTVVTHLHSWIENVINFPYFRWNNACGLNFL